NISIVHKMLLQLQQRLLKTYYCQVQIQRVDLTLDMETDQGDDYMHLPDRGIFHDGTSNSRELSCKILIPKVKLFLKEELWITLVIILHVDVELEDPRTVAEALAREESDEYAKQERLDRISRMTEMEDLQAPHDHPLAPLCIEDPRDYFDFQQLKTSDDTRAGTEQLRCSLSSEKAYGSFMGSVSEIKAVGLSDPIVRPEDAVMMLNGLTQNISSTKRQLGKNAQESILNSLPNTTKEELLHVSTVKDAMSKFYPQLEALDAAFQYYEADLQKRSAKSGDKPNRYALDAAFQHYETDLQKRSAKSGDKPNGYVQE
ncbi:general transcription and dna repair factor iih subunit tfb1-1, partial [Quercus suber]